MHMIQMEFHPKNLKLKTKYLLLNWVPGNEVAAVAPVVDDTALAPLDAGPLALAARSALPTSQYLTLESEVETQRPPWSGVSIIFSTGADSRKTSARFPSRRRSCQKTCASRPDEYTFKRK